MTSVSARKVWEAQGLSGKLLWLSLLPASFLYSMAMQVRNALYAHGLMKSLHLGRPVVSVGNLTVGGTGKTPACLWLAKELSDRGLRVGILSRGYRRKAAVPLVLQAKGGDVRAVGDNDIIEAGDEPLMMARLYGQTVGVCEDRLNAASEVLRKVNVDVFILDDGFQHRRVKRTVDLLLLGADASGWVLPAGPFRERRGNLRRADFLISTAGNGAWNDVIARGRASPCFTAALRPVALISLAARGCKEFPLTLLYRSKILTVTGIADPRGLYRLIHEWEGEIVETLEFPDHHCYTARDWQQINRMARLVDLIITTEKDILKLTRFPFAKDKLLALRVAMTVENGPALVGAIVEKIDQARSRTGSMAGSEKEP
jgi:tetraacyldisaccharide 4'-kinase